MCKHFIGVQCLSLVVLVAQVTVVACEENNILCGVILHGSKEQLRSIDFQLEPPFCDSFQKS